MAKDYSGVAGKAWLHLYENIFKFERFNKMKLTKILASAVVSVASASAMAGWVPYETITLDGYANTVPGGVPYNEVTIPSGVYRFRIDPTSVGVDYATNQSGNTQSKSAGLMVYDRTTTTDKTAAVTYYGLNYDGIHESGIIHAFPQTGGVDLYLQDWQRVDNTGSVKVIIEKWQ
ncbi:hypothetical protein [Burkholderia gladioli]|uniref:hypothetical protein n=1 Tax=Burkholderia gladioli TaxID=28095 RepID=UPI001ABA6778|nr:hypothetical protein [Burkholderia gladioli]